MQIDNILIEPIVTEKSNLLREAHKYTFKVHAKANKTQIKAAVKELFNCEPVACTVVNVRGKKRAIGSRGGYRRGYGATPSWKKAIITLKEGDQIEIFEGV